MSINLLTQDQTKAMYSLVLDCQRTPSVAMDTLLQLLSALPLESYGILFSESVEAELKEQVKSHLSGTYQLGQGCLGTSGLITAIKHVRQVKGWGLKECKEYVDAIRETLGTLPSQDSQKYGSVTKPTEAGDICILSTIALHEYNSFEGTNHSAGEPFTITEYDSYDDTVKVLHEADREPDSSLTGWWMPVGTHTVIGGESK